MEKNKNIEFLQIPTQIIKDKTIRDVDKFIYGVIVYRSNDLGYCWSSNQDLATQIGVSPTGITDCLARLENAGYIIRENKTSIKRKIIPKLILGIIHNQPKSNEVQHESNDLSIPIQPKSNDLHNINIYNNINNIITKFQEINSDYQKFFKIPSYRKCIERLLESNSHEEIVARLKYAFERMKSGDRFAIQIHTPMDLENKWIRIKPPVIDNTNIDDLLKKYNK